MLSIIYTGTEKGEELGKSSPRRSHPRVEQRFVAQVKAEEKDPLAVDPLETVVLDGPEKFSYISFLLSSEEKEQLQCILLRNVDMFAWNHLDMIRIDPMLVSHKLNIIPAAEPVRRKVRRLHPDRHQIIQTEVDNLMRAVFIREVKYPEWLANVLVVIKKGGKWRVCVDYTDLNEGCP